MATLTASSSSSGILKRCGSSFDSCGDMHDIKRLKQVVEGSDHSPSDLHISSSNRCLTQSSTPFSSDVVKTSTGDRRLVGASPSKQETTATVAQTEVKSSLVNPIPTDLDASQVSDSNSSLSATNVPTSEEILPALPLKSTHFRHLQQKYSGELEYMLREFQKLERQLLGAKTAVGAAASESVASRERREKLHSFIQHLEDTIQQINTGVELEAAGQSTFKPDARDTSALSEHVSREKEEEEAVQKIEEHILANLLPVKVRLKKQLAAQQGAKHNPAGMPTARGGLILGQADTSQQGKATFLSKVEERRSSLLGSTTLHGGGSNLTQKLHGPPTSGSASQAEPETQVDVVKDTSTAGKSSSTNKVLYAGLALGSEQILSSVQAANAVHKVEIQDPSLIQVRSKLYLALQETSSQANTPTSVDYADLKLSTLATDESDDLPLPESGDEETALSDDYDYDEPDHIYSKHGTQLSLAAHAAILSYEEKRKARKKRRKRKKLLLLKQQEQQELQQQQQQQQVPVVVASTGSIPKRKKVVKKRGPQNVEYMCALCNEVYNSTCECNPWWALTQHECPKCNKMQIPRIDIGAPANAIEYHPALLAHADENGGVGGHAPEAVILPPLPPPPITETKETPISDTDEVLESDLSDDDGLLSDDDSFYCSDSDNDAFPILSSADRAENEKFGLEYDGPTLSDTEASRLLTLMLHATTCPCQHLDTNHLEVCRSAKYMMLHVRDCPGTTASFDVCPFPWCRKVKHLLYHLVSCSEPSTCPICSNVHLNRNMRQLKGLNYYRGEKFQAVLFATNKAKAEAAVTGKLNEESQSSEGVNRESRAHPGEKVLSAEINADRELDGSLTGVDYSIVPPIEDLNEPTNSLASSGKNTTDHFILATVKVEDDYEARPSANDTMMKEPTDVPITSLSRKVEAQVNVDTVAVVPIIGKTTAAGSTNVETSVNSAEHLLGNGVVEDLNSVTPDGTKG